MPQIVFVSLFLGLVSGIQPVEVRVGPDVRSVRITIDGKDAATMREAPWKTKVDFGNDILPHHIAAIGSDERGEEIARTSQIVNLRRPFAEVAIEVKHENATPAAIELIGRHRQFIKPKSATITVDGKRLSVSKSFTARLPKLDWKRPHIISAEMRYPDGNVARRDLVLSGGVSYTSGSELTPVVIRRNFARFGKLDGCFSADGLPLRTAAFERTSALVVVVKDPDASDAQVAIRAMGETGQKFFWKETELDRDSTVRVVFPVSQRFRQENEESILFEKSIDLDAEEAPFAKLLALRFHVSDFEEPRRVADAVAVAGLETLVPMRRRAVVLLLGNKDDHSIYRPATVRRYLASIGVPLFVWSLSGARPDLAGTWGEVQNVSTRDNLREAVEQLRRVLDEQSVVWVPADPLTALRTKANESCGVEVLAGR